MKKINLKGISEILSEKELKNVMGGSGGTLLCLANCTSGDLCYYEGKQGTCLATSILANCACHIFL